MGCVCDKLESWLGAGLVDIKAEIYTLPTMSDLQKKYIQDGWRILSQDLGNIGVLTFVGYVVVIF